MAEIDIKTKTARAALDGDLVVGMDAAKADVVVLNDVVGKTSAQTITGIKTFSTAASPVMTSPVLGTPGSGNLANCTGYPGTSALVTVGALDSGSITSGFGAINNGSSTITTTGAVATGALTVSGVTLRTGGDKTAMVAVPDGAAYTVLASNSGKIHIIANQAQDCTLTLPAVAAGLLYEFWHGMEAADGHDWIFDTTSDTNFYKGGLLWADSDAGPAAAEVKTIAGNGSSNSKLQVNLPSTGTFIKIYCDGTNWFLNGMVLSTTVPAFANQ